MYSYDESKTLINVSTMSWAYRTSPPPDEPFCGFAGEALCCRPQGKAYSTARTMKNIITTFGLITVTGLGPGMIAVAAVLPILLVAAMAVVIILLFLK